MIKSNIIYLVEDDTFIQESLQFMLEPFGYNFKQYSTGELFLASIGNSPIRCLLLDVRLPGMSGLEIQDYLCKHYYCSVPIIFMSGHVDEKAMENALKNGAIGFLYKPFGANQLIRLIEKAFSRDPQILTIQTNDG